MPASRSPRSACRCTAAWASSRRPARRALYRDARIAPIYEGTNGIQAIDLVTRKLQLAGGQHVLGYIAELGESRRCDPRPPTCQGFGRAAEAIDRRSPTCSRRRVSCRRRWPRRADEQALAGATPYLRLIRADGRRRLSRQGALAASASADRALPLLCGQSARRDSALKDAVSVAPKALPMPARRWFRLTDSEQGSMH